MPKEGEMRKANDELFVYVRPAGAGILLIAQNRHLEVSHFFGVPCFSKSCVNKIFFVEWIYINDADPAGMNLKAFQDVFHYATHDRFVKGVEEKDAIRIGRYLKIKGIVVDDREIHAGNPLFCDLQVCHCRFAKFLRKVNTG